MEYIARLIDSGKVDVTMGIVQEIPHRYSYIRGVQNGGSMNGRHLVFKDVDVLDGNIVTFSRTFRFIAYRVGFSHVLPEPA